MMNEGDVKVVGVIPARYASTRLPGKPLADIGGHPMVEWVYRRAEAALGYAIVATDDERIVAAVEAFGGRAVLTCEAHRSGTDRVAETLVHLRQEGVSPEVVVNVQGDEPFLDGANLRRLVMEFDDERVRIATLVRAFGEGEDVQNPSWPKVVLDEDGDALLFSRSVIPYARNEEFLPDCPRYKHIGVYAFRANALQEVSRLSPTPLEQLEGLEQLRWLESGYRIRAVRVENEGLSVDTPGDLARARELAEGRWVG